MSNKPIQTKRIYNDASINDGYRVLVDRVWPRGVSKEQAKLDDWMKEIAPSTDLRKWFGHESEKFEEFKNRYKEELENNEDLVNQLVTKSEKKKVTLLYGAKDEEHNQAVVLESVLKEKRDH
jgi:uncharacterized protein YeaO (DUF488 family)